MRCHKTADRKGKHYPQTVVMSQCITSMLVQCHLPTDINIIRSYQQEYCDKLQLTCASLSCLLAIWRMRMNNLAISCDGIQALLTSWWTFISIYHSIWRPPIFLSTYLKLNCPMPNVQFDIPRNAEILQKLWEWHYPIPIVYISEHVWTEPGKLLKSLFRTFIFLKFWMLNVLPYVWLEGENDEDSSWKMEVMLVHRHGFTREELCWIKLMQ